MIILSGAYKASSIYTFWFQLTHPNPYKWNTLSIHYAPDMAYANLEKGSILFYCPLKANNGTLEMYPSSRMNPERTKFEAEHMSPPFRLVEYKEYANNIALIHFEREGTNIEERRFVLHDTGLVCSYAGDKDDYHLYESTLMSAVFGDE